jgi:hypothetical protein
MDMSQKKLSGFTRIERDEKGNIVSEETISFTNRMSVTLDVISESVKELTEALTIAKVQDVQIVNFEEDGSATFEGTYPALFSMMRSLGWDSQDASEILSEYGETA